MPNRHRCILIVEDDIDIREVLKDVCEAEGYVVFMADNGTEALSKLDMIPRPCLILTDLMMPVMNGWELVDKLTEDHDLAAIPVIVMSAVNPNGVKHVRKFIRKPFELEAVLEAIREECDRSCPR